MTFKEAVSSVIHEYFQGGGIFITSEQRKALTEHTVFFDGIPDSDKEKVADRLYWEIYAFNGDQFQSSTVPPLVAKPIRVVKSDLDTVNDFLELLEKIYLDVPATMDGRIFSLDEGYITAQTYAKILKQDLEVLSKGKARCKQSELLQLQKGRYYSNAITKEDIKNIVIEILNEYSLPVYTKERRRVYDEFIARL